MERLFEVAKCKDEAVLALALRRHANDFVNVAEDGKSLLLANHDALMSELDEWDAKCVYLVHTCLRFQFAIQTTSREITLDLLL